MKERILVLFGGKSVEHDISIITALQAMRNLPEKFDFMPVYMDKKGLWWTAENLGDIHIYSNFEKLAKKKKQVSLILGENQILIKKGNKFVKGGQISGVLNCCHGNIGEDGSVQGLFKVCDVPQTCSELTSMALCMDKAFMKDIFKANGINSPHYVTFKELDYKGNKAKLVKQIGSKVSYPLVVKPSNLGSSIGISVCKTEGELDNALMLAFEFDKKVVIERLVENLKEFNCACFCYKGNFYPSKVNEVTNKSEIYTFEDKYLSENAKNQEADKKLSKKIQTLTEKVYKLFDCKGVVRVDFLFNEKANELYVNEINSIPGSLAFYLYKDIAFKDILTSMIEESKFLHASNNTIKSFDSDALKIFDSVAKTYKK